MRTLFAFMGMSVANLYGQTPLPPNPAPATPPQEAALNKARLLYTMLNGTLSVMHRDFFRPNDHKIVPSESLKDVFRAIASEHQVTIRWLASEETLMNPDNSPQDEKAEAALARILKGESEVSTTDGHKLRFTGSIKLQNQCLKCHVPNRKSLENRFAAVEILVPLQQPAQTK